MAMRSTFVVAALLMAIAVDARSIPSPDDDPNLKVLYYLRDNKLYQLKPPFLVEKLLTSSRDVSDFDVDADAEPVWLGNETRVYRRRGESAISISSEKLALDHLTSKLYLVGGDFRSVHVMQQDGKETVLFEGSTNVREKLKALALDPSSGLMFVLADLDGVKNIYRADMDGTEKRKIAEGVSSDELVVDPQQRKIYWVNAERGIVESVDYRGIKRQAVGGLGGVTNESAIAVLNGEMYWSVDGGFINICKLRENSCDDKTVHHLQLPPSSHPIKKLKVSTRLAPKDITSKANACEPNNGGCEHICLLNSRNASGCACDVGWEAHGKECKSRSRPKRQYWDVYEYNMYTSQATMKTEPEPRDAMGDLPVQISIMGK